MMFPRHPVNDSWKPQQFASFEIWVISFLCFKLFFHRILHLRVRKQRLLCLSELGILVLHKNTRKLYYHLKQAQKSISNLSNLQKM